RAVALVEVQRADEPRVERILFHSPDDLGGRLRIGPGSFGEGQRVVRVQRYVARPSEVEFEFDALDRAEVNITVRLVVAREHVLDDPAADQVFDLLVDAGNLKRGACADSLAESELVGRRLLRTKRRVVVQLRLLSRQIPLLRGVELIGGRPLAHHVVAREEDGLVGYGERDTDSRLEGHLRIIVREHLFGYALNLRSRPTG